MTRFLQTFSACLAALVAVLSSTAAANAPLQLRVDALAQQIRYRYPEQADFETVRGTIESVLGAWNRAPHTATNRAAMQSWLDTALRRNMPGGSGKLPAPPEFDRSAPITAEAVPAPSIRQEALADEERSLIPQPTPNEPVEKAPAVVVEPAPQRRKVARPVDPIEPPKTESPLVDRPAEKPLRNDPPQRSKWSKHPAAAPLKWNDPFVDDFSASPNPLRSGTRQEVRRPVAPSKANARVDLVRLQAEIRGYNAEFRELQRKLTNLEQGDPQAAQRAVEQWQALESRREFLEIYRSGLAASGVVDLPELPSAELLRELVRRQAGSALR